MPGSGRAADHAHRTRGGGAARSAGKSGAGRSGAGGSGAALIDRDALARADLGTRTRTVVELQRIGGNAAVARRLSGIGLPTRHPRIGTGGELLLQRRKDPPKPKLKKTPFDRAALEAIRTNAEQRHVRITDFIRSSRSTLQNYKTRLLNAGVVYKAAFKRHKAVLDEAETAARDRAQMISTIAGLATGVVLGAPGSLAKLGLTALAQRAGTAFAVGGELVELVVGTGAGMAAAGPEPGAFDPTAEIPELKDLAVWQTIAEMSDKLLSVSLLTAKLLKIVSASGIAIAEVRLREGGAANVEKSDADLHALVAALRQADEASAAVDAALESAAAEIAQLGATPARSMSVEEVEQNIWIEWIADLTDDDLLDEDDITDHLEALGVIGEGRLSWDEEDGYTREPPRLAVDFGSWVSDADERDAVAAAREKLGRPERVPASEAYDDEDY